jgi:hypothetical protein
MRVSPVRHPGLALCAGIIIRRDFRALLERTNPEERRATGPSWIHFRAQDVRNPLVGRPFNWFKSPLGHSQTASQRSWVSLQAIALRVSYRNPESPKTKTDHIYAPLLAAAQLSASRGPRGRPICGEDWLLPWHWLSQWLV